MGQSAFRRSDPSLEKAAAAAAAAELISDGMIVGLGTGSTAELFLRRLAERVRDGLRIMGVPTSTRTRELAEHCGIELCPPDAVLAADITVDGADEIDPALCLIKGAGGALLYEKIVAASSRAMVVIADSSKRVTQLGRCDLPVEVVPFGWERTAARIAEGAAAFGHGSVAVKRRVCGTAPYRTDAGHWILDCSFGGIPDAAGLAAFLDGTPGVVEHGLFIGLASAALVGNGTKVDVIGTLP